jgi:dienelactone hydrolase
MENKNRLRTRATLVSLLASAMVAACATDGPAPQVTEPTDSVLTIRSGEWELIGTLMTPVGAGRAPAALLLNRAGGDRTAYEGLARTLAAKGIMSLRVDLRGHGESVNAGTFVPFAPGATDLLIGTEEDIGAALRFLGAHARVDPERIAVVGSSYSGELAIVAARDGLGEADVYALLSPGSLSSESIAWLDQKEGTWFFAASRRENTQATQDVIAEVLETSTAAEIHLTAGQGHATGLFDASPSLVGSLGEWLSGRLLTATPSPS